MCIIVCLYPRGTSGSSTSAAGASPNRASALPSIYVAAATTASTAVADVTFLYFFVFLFLLPPPLVPPLPPLLPPPSRISLTSSAKGKGKSVPT